MGSMLVKRPFKWWARRAAAEPEEGCVIVGRPAPVTQAPRRRLSDRFGNRFFEVGDLVTRDGTDIHRVVDHNGQDGQAPDGMTVVCVKAPPAGWCEVGDESSTPAAATNGWAMSPKADLNLAGSPAVLARAMPTASPSPGIPIAVDLFGHVPCLPAGTISYKAPPVRVIGGRIEVDHRAQFNAEWRAVQALKLTPAQEAVLREWNKRAVGCGKLGEDFGKRCARAFREEVVTEQRAAAFEASTNRESFVKNGPEIMRFVAPARDLSR